MELKIERAKVAAKILIDCGYAVKSKIWLGRFDTPYQWVSLERGEQRPVNPFEDNIDSITQAHIIENWLNMYHSDLWEQSKILRIPQTDKMLDMHQWRLSRMDMCLEALKTRGFIT